MNFKNWMPTDAMIEAENPASSRLSTKFAGKEEHETGLEPHSESGCNCNGSVEGRQCVPSR
jgi:hypothetical protein